MSLFSKENHFHSHDNSTRITFPDTIKVNEYKAPTDESIRMMEEMHAKALKNIIHHIKVEDNLVNGEIFVVHQPWLRYSYKVVCKFKINGKEFVVDKDLDGINFENVEQGISILHAVGHDTGKAIMLQFALKSFVAIAFEQITNRPIPAYLNQPL